MTVLIVAEHDNAALKQSTRSAHTAATIMGMFADGELHVLLAGDSADGALADAVQMTGVSKVLHAESPKDASDSPCDIAAVVSGIAAGYSHIVFAGTSYGERMAACVAAKLRVEPICDITAVLSAETFQRSRRGEKPVDAVGIRETTKVITVCTSAFEPISTDAGCAIIEGITPAAATAPLLAKDRAINATGPVAKIAGRRNILSGIELLAKKLAAATRLRENQLALSDAPSPTVDLTQVISMVHDLELDQLDRTLLTQGEMCA